MRRLQAESERASQLEAAASTLRARVEELESEKAEAEAKLATAEEELARGRAGALAHTRKRVADQHKAEIAAINSAFYSSISKSRRQLERRR